MTETIPLLVLIVQVVHVVVYVMSQKVIRP